MNTSLRDILLVVLGTGLLIYALIPKQVDYIASRFRGWLISITDRLTPKSTLLILFALTAIGFPFVLTIYVHPKKM